jgi:hypothetical protein
MLSSHLRSEVPVFDINVEFNFGLRMCGIHVETQNVHTISVGKREIKDYLEKLAVDSCLQENCYENIH